MEFLLLDINMTIPRKYFVQMKKKTYTIMVFYRESLDQYTRYHHQKFEFEFCSPRFVHIKLT